MNFEDLQKAWQSQDPGAKVTVNAEVLLKEVRLNQQHFRATIFWRDVREVGVAAILACLFLYWAIRDRQWSSYLLAVACFGVGAFMLVDRWLQRRKQPVTNEPLRSCIEASLLQINHQIWLLKNVLWWYLLPIMVGLAAAIGSQTWEMRAGGTRVFIGLAGCTLLIGSICWGVYWLNQFAVRKGLEPRRHELETLLTSLNENSP
jgi:phosphoglycerol transferase MdoB-like AlkP superfamily enzyme